MAESEKIISLHALEDLAQHLVLFLLGVNFVKDLLLFFRNSR